MNYSGYLKIINVHRKNGIMENWNSGKNEECDALKQYSTLNFEPTPISQENENATKTQSHKDSQRTDNQCLLILIFVHSWLSLF